MDLFHFQEEAPGSVFWHAKGWTLFPGAGAIHPPPGRLPGYIEVNSQPDRSPALGVNGGVDGLSRRDPSPRNADSEQV